MGAAGRIEKPQGMAGEARTYEGGAARGAARRRGNAARGGAAREAVRPGGVVDVRAGWQRTGIRAAEGLGARELGPGLLIPCREIAREENTTPIVGDDLSYIAETV